MTNDEASSELRFDPPAPGFYELDPVHFPRPLTRYWTEVPTRRRSRAARASSHASTEC